MVLAVVVSLLAVPIAAAVGTAVYDSRRHPYAEHADTRHSVTATVTDVPDSPMLRAGTIPFRRDGRPTTPNTPAQSRRNRQPKLVTLLRYGSTTAEQWFPRQPRPPRRRGSRDERTRDLDKRGRHRGDPVHPHPGSL